ncbi:MAG: NAD(P)-dependent oxidoreductase [Candidatus Beckwithbacteria bacterium]
MKILITEPLDAEVVDNYAKKYTEFVFQQTTNFFSKKLSEQISAGKDCSGMIVRSQTRVSKKLVEQLPSLKIVISACSGSDNIDKRALQLFKIKYLNSANCNYESTAEHIICLLLALAKNLILANNSLRDGHWCKNEFISQKISGKILGIIGLGKVGKCLAQKAVGLGLKVVAYDPYFTLKNNINKIKLVKLNTLINQSDFISLCVPLTNLTNNLIGKNELNLMKPSSFLINCSRGKVVDEQALYTACKNNRIQGAALDVFSNEPEINNKLCQSNNIIVTPHIAGQTKESLIRSSEYALSSIIKYLKEI